MLLTDKRGRRREGVVTQVNWWTGGDGVKWGTVRVDFGGGWVADIDLAHPDKEFVARLEVAR